MINFRLDKTFTNTEVCHATGIEIDIIKACYDFCLENIPSFDHTWLHDAMLDYLSAKESEINSNDLAHFTHETLQDSMNDYAPIGCYFGSHEGDSTRGYWEILDLSTIGDNYTDCQPLPYREKGYPLFPESSGIDDKLTHIATFLDDMFYEESAFSDFTETLQESPEVEYSCMLIDAFIDNIVPLIAPKHMTWRINEGVYGIYPELPGYRETEDISVLVQKSPPIAKMVFLVENRQSRLFEKLDSIQSLNGLCLDVANTFHFMSFNDALKKSAKFSASNIADYIANNNYLLTWTIEHIFWNDYKNQIDKLLGNQDITQLFLDVLATGSSINGINEEVYTLRESCNICKNIEDFEESDTDCDCVDFNELNNVWIISEKRFYDALQNQGAMVYETDSMYLYFQTTHSGYYYDNMLRSAWLSCYCPLGIFQRSEL